MSDSEGTKEFREELLKLLDVHPDAFSLYKNWRGKIQVSWLPSYGAFGNVPRQTRIYKGPDNAAKAFKRSMKDRYDAGMVHARINALTRRQSDVTCHVNIDRLLPSDDPIATELQGQLSFMGCSGSGYRSHFRMHPEGIPIIHELLDTHMAKMKCPICGSKKLIVLKFWDIKCGNCKSLMNILNSGKWKVSKARLDKLKEKQVKAQAAKAPRPRPRPTFGSTTSTNWYSN